MARPMSEETKREKTAESLRKALISNKVSERFIEDKIDEYMSFYDDLQYINSELITMKQAKTVPLKEYTNATAEKRKISSEMRHILAFLGLKPTDITLSSGSEEDEEL